MIFNILDDFLLVSKKKKNKIIKNYEYFIINL